MTAIDGTPMIAGADPLRHCLEDGNPEGEPVILIHALGATQQMWRPQLADLAAWRVIRYDLPGHGGRAPLPSMDATIDAYVNDVFAMCDDLRLDRFSLVGSSFGGMIAQRAAARAGARVPALVLVSCALRMGTPAVWDGRIAAVNEQGVEALVEPTMSRWFAAATKESSADIIASFAHGFRATSVQGYADAARAMRDLDLSAGAGAITARTIAVGGAEDAAAPPEAVERMAAAIPGARSVIVDDAAHMVNAEQPARFNALVRGHLAGSGHVAP